MECASTSPVMTECGMCDVLYAVLYVRVSCFVVHGCAISRRYTNAIVICLVLLMCILTI